MKPSTDSLPPAKGQKRAAAWDARHARILAVAQVLFAEFGIDTIGFARLASALRLSTATLRRHFEDLAAIETAVAVEVAANPAKLTPPPVAPKLTAAQLRARIDRCGRRAD